MRRYSIFIIAIVITLFAGMANASAANISSQSIDVTVGEVDSVSADNENQDIHTPDTGLFGLDADSTMPIVIAATVPAIAILACVFLYFYRKHTKN